MNQDTNNTNKKNFSFNPLRLFRGGGQINQTSDNNPVNVLTEILTSLQQGGQITVASQEINIPGPINNAKGSPIIFKSDGQTYFAYSQENPVVIDSKQSPADIAATMAIVKAPTNEASIPTTLAHVDKAGLIVNDKEMGVGYSIGGASTGKTPTPSPAAVNSEISTLQQERQLMGNAISDAPKPVTEATRSVNFPPTSNYAVHNQTESASTLAETKAYVSENQTNSHNTTDSTSGAGWITPKPEKSTPITETNKNSNLNNSNPHTHPFGENPF